VSARSRHLGTHTALRVVEPKSGPGPVRPGPGAGTRAVEWAGPAPQIRPIRCPRPTLLRKSV